MAMRNTDELLISIERHIESDILNALASECDTLYRAACKSLNDVLSIRHAWDFGLIHGTDLPW